jgi:hypothetical protein
MAFILDKSQARMPRQGMAYEPAKPLWQRVPSHDEHGQRLSDFMMVIPGLKKRPPDEIRCVLETVAAVLQRYDQVVMYADMNLKINTLWVSIRPVVGMCLEIPAAIKVAVPEAMLVASKET